MAVFRTKFERVNFGFDPALYQTADVVFEVDADEYTEDNYNLFDEAAWAACSKQNPQWFEDYSAPVEGYSGWSSVLTTGAGYTKVVDVDLDFDLGTPGEGLPRIAESFTDNREDDVEFAFSWQRHSWRVTGFYKTYVPPICPEDQKKAMEDVHKLLTELDEEDQAKMTPSQRLRAQQMTRIIQCPREEAEYVSGSGVAGTIRRLEDITITGRVNWEDRTIAMARRDYKPFEEYPTNIWMYWLAVKNKD